MLKRSLALAHCLFLCALLCPAQDKLKSVDQRQILQQILVQTYQPSDVGKRLMGVGAEADIRRAGTIVVIQREGLFGSLNRNEIASSAIHGGDARLYRGHTDYPVPVGERFYVTAINVGSSSINFGLLSARSVSTSQGAGRVWTAPTFYFPQETLANADKDAVIRAIDSWFIPEGRTSFAPPPAASASPVPTSASAAPSIAPATAAPVVNLLPGVARDEITTQLGKPQREINFQSQTWLYYPGMIVVLRDGKLVSVDSPGAATANVAFASEPPAAEIYLDGLLVGSTPSTLALSPGDHHILLRLPAFQDWIRDLHVLPGSEIRLDATLVRVQ